ncbi:outer membrane beta-barrel family protein [Phenylobacterium sp.]|uniref:outer membrane beta-barrel family protein n=1 Tax=Phenylobacterium sp. TaxID=1871053 RepID=UPI0025F67D8C|nr:outer membrane beta-barrel family protein [Phenylobacterium sp.]
MCLGLAAMAAAAPAFAQPAAPTPPAPKSQPNTVGEVRVEGTAPPVRTSIDRKSYSVTDDLHATTGSISDALRNVPSVEVDVQGAVSLRGDPNVTILVDGKPSSQFAGESRSQALQSLPAERIERVEVIANPSAEFRADGAAGVINLVTKRARGAGRTGGARVTVGGQGQVFGGANAGYNSKDLTVTADGFFRHDLQKQAFSEDRGRLDPATGAFAGSTTRSIQPLEFNIVGGRVAADYDIGPKTRLSGELRGQFIDFRLDGFGPTLREDGAGALAQAYDRAIRVDQQRGGGEITAGLLRRFDGEGHDFKLTASFEAVEEDRTRSGSVLSRVPPAPIAFDRQHVLTSLRQVQVKGDYQRPMDGGGRLKAGFDLQWDDNEYDNRGFTGPTQPASTPNAALSNLFRFDRRLLQGYVTYERPIGDLTVLAGLRLEDVSLDLDQVTQGRRDDQDGLKAYPSLHLAWKLDDSRRLTASYSHRIQRPQPEQYNSFRFLIDPITFRSGSADLKPQETHSLEAGFEYRRSPAIYLATLYYRETFDSFTDVTRDLGGGVFLIRQENLGKMRNAGLELTANGRLAKDLTYNVSGNAAWTEIDASASQGIAGTRSTASLSGRASVNWQVTPNDLIQVSGFLNGRRLTPQGSLGATGMLNLGYRHKFDDRFTLVVSAQDVLNTFRNTIVVNDPTLRSRIRYETDTTQVFVGVVWTFGGGRPRDQGFDFQQGGAPPG